MNLIYCKHYRKKDYYYVSNKKKFLCQIQIRISDSIGKSNELHNEELLYQIIDIEGEMFGKVYQQLEMVDYEAR